MSLNNSQLPVLPLLIVLVIAACSPHSVRPDKEEIDLLQKAVQNVSSEYFNPRLVSGELEVHVKNIVPLSGDELRASNLAAGLPADQAPSLHIWSSAIRSFPTQRVLSGATVNPQPDSIFLDPQYGNQILYWKHDLMTNADFSITRNFRYITFDYKPRVDREAERTHWHEIPQEILDNYTRAEKFMEQDDALIDIVFTLLEEIVDPVSQAEAIYNWVQNNMTYEYPPEERGVRNAFTTLRGDCGQYTALFMTMCRIAGIPARQQSGFNFVHDNTGAHVWSEIYLPVKGWVPVDATRENGFLFLDNKRLISSIGLNIPLKHAPQWATYDNSEVENGKTDFMQMYTLVSSGLKAKYSTSRRVIRSVELN